MSSPFNEAQAQAEYDPSQGTPPEPVATGSMQPGAPSGFSGTGVQGPRYADGSVGAIGKLRDTLMGQFPEINNMSGDEPLNLSGSEKLGLLAVAVKNPQGALDLVRDRRARHQRQREAAARLNLQMLGVAGDIVKTQNGVEEAMFNARLAAQKFKLDRDRSDFDQELQRGKQGLIAAQTETANLQNEGLRSTNAAVGQLTASPTADPLIADGTLGSAGGYGRPDINVGPGGTSLQYASPDAQKSDPVMSAFNNYFATRQSKSVRPLDPNQVYQEFLGLMAARQRGGAPSMEAVAPPGGSVDLGLDPNLGE